MRIVRDQPLVFTAAHHVINVVFNPGFALPQDFKFALWVIHIQHPVFRGQRRACGDDEVLFTSRGTHSHAEALICLGEHADVFALWGA